MWELKRRAAVLMAGAQLRDAVQSGDTAAVRRLVLSGADVDGGGVFEPLYDAAEKGHAETAKALLQLGATVDGLDPRGTPLHVAALRGHANVATVLLEAGADTRATFFGETPLQCAIKGGHTAVERVLRQFAQRRATPQTLPAAQETGTRLSTPEAALFAAE
jgi:ankyrin repeat protein